MRAEQRPADRLYGVAIYVLLNMTYLLSLEARHTLRAEEDKRITKCKSAGAVKPWIDKCEGQPRPSIEGACSMGNCPKLISLFFPSSIPALVRELTLGPGNPMGPSMPGSPCEEGTKNLGCDSSPRSRENGWGSNPGIRGQRPCGDLTCRPFCPGSPGSPMLPLAP